LSDLIRRVALGKTDSSASCAAGPASNAQAGVRAAGASIPKPAKPRTLVEIIAEDRPGLLYSLASVFI